MNDELERLRRELLTQSECAKLLGRIVAEKDADRIFFRNKAQDLERQLSDLRAEVAGMKGRCASLEDAAERALHLIEKGAPGWGVAKDILRLILAERK